MNCPCDKPGYPEFYRDILIYLEIHAVEVVFWHIALLTSCPHNSSVDICLQLVGARHTQMSSRSSHPDSSSCDVVNAKFALSPTCVQLLFGP